MESILLKSSLLIFWTPSQKDLAVTGSEFRLYAIGIKTGHQADFFNLLIFGISLPSRLKIKF
jgi:hypothetical protein